MHNGVVITEARQSLEHLTDFADSSKSKLKAALWRSFSECSSGMSGTDVGTNHRLSVLKVLPGTLLSEGVVTAQPFGLERPLNTTWLSVPTALGIELLIVNCVRRKDDETYLLTRSEVQDLANFALSEPLIDLREHMPHVMLAICWKRVGPRRSYMRFAVNLLGGHLDLKTRVFKATQQIPLVCFDTLSDSIPEDQHGEAKGPSPELRPRKGRE